jgi:hypothetical protein
MFHFITGYEFLTLNGEFYIFGGANYEIKIFIR